MPTYKDTVVFSSVVIGIVLLYWFLAHDYSSKHDTEKEDYIPPIQTARGPMGQEDMEETVLRPAGLWTRQNDIITQTEYLSLPNCSLVMAEWLQRNQMYDPKSPIPTEVPKGVMDMFTKKGLIQLIEGLNVEKYDRSSITWTKEQIEQLILKEAKDFTEYDGAGTAMFHAMQSVDVKGKTGLIFGTSKEPWIEAFALQQGALQLIKTGPVNIAVENYPYVAYADPVEIARKYHDFINTFDFAASFSIENMGFGRVDPFNPNGDILELQKTYCMLKHEGILFLGIPIGWDSIIWNSSRVYGRIRLGLITAAWDVVTMFEYDEEKKINLEIFQKTSQPGEHRWVVLVLKKRHDTGGLF